MSTDKSMSKTSSASWSTNQRHSTTANHPDSAKTWTHSSIDRVMKLCLKVMPLVKRVVCNKMTVLWSCAWEYGRGTPNFWDRNATKTGSLTLFTSVHSSGRRQEIRQTRMLCQRTLVFRTCERMGTSTWSSKGLLMLKIMIQFLLL